MPRPIDPFARGIDGCYVDDAVVVRRKRFGAGHAGRFALGREGERLLLQHDLCDAELDNDLAALLTAELFAPGWVTGADTFERLFTGVVLSCRRLPIDAWEAFYRNTLRRLDEQPADACGAEGTLAGIAPVYRRAESLVAEGLGFGPGRVLDLGSCFGFFPLRLAAGAAGAGVRVIGSDVAPGTCDLLDRICIRLELPVRVLDCDAANVPLPSGSVDVVTVLHVLEHVPAAHGDRILAEALRLARRRVVVAVPLEDEPDLAFGHVRTLTPGSLAASAAPYAAGWRATVTEHHGAFLVLDRT